MTASVPFMITQAQIKRLLALGYSQAHIDAMRPSEAHAILAEFDAPQLAVDANLDFSLDDVPELNPDPTPAACTLAADTQRFFSILWRGAPYGMVQNLNAGPEFDKRRSLYIPTGKSFKLPAAWQNDHSNIFHGVNPTIIRREYFEAARSADVAALNSLYREYDAKDFTFPTPWEVGACLPIVKAKDDQRVADALTLDPASKVRPASTQALQNQAEDMTKDEKFKANPEHYMKLVRAHVDALTPAPSIIIKSGGGYQCYWFLAETFVIKTALDDQAAHVQSYAEDLQRRWVHLDPRADEGVNDTRRILRTPGTYNHKKKYAPNYPQVTFYQKRFGLQYALSGLAALLPAPVAAVATGPIQSHQATEQRTAYQGESVIAAYNAKYRLADVLVQYGYTHAGGNRYTRPGGLTTAGVELFPLENNARIWSSNDPLYNGSHRCTPFTVMCVYDHNGDIRAAVKAAAAELGMVREAKPETKQRIQDLIQNARTWLQSANFAELIPQHLQSAKGYRTNARDKRLFSGYLDLFAKYGSTRGPISNQQLSLASGLSESTVRNATKALIAAGLIRHIAAPEGTGPGAFWYELVLLPAFENSCVGCAVLDSSSGELYRATYATVFTGHKVHDAFQRGGSKSQRQKATIKALGPDVLIFLDTLHDHGRQTCTELGTRTHQSKYTVSRIKRRLEAHEIISVEKVGSHHYLTIQPDWLDAINELTPSMPTYGKKFNREFNAQVRTLDYCDLLSSRSQADQGDNRRRARAEKKLFTMIESEAAYQFVGERVDEIMHRLKKHDAKRRAAKAYTPTRPNFVQQIKLEQLHAQARMDLAEQRHKAQWETARLLSENIAALKASNTPKREWFSMLTLAGFTPNEAKQAIKFGGSTGSVSTVP